MKYKLLVFLLISALLAGAAAEEDALFDLFGDPVYLQTYRRIAADGVITEGTVSDAAKGLQLILISLGQPIRADGAAGAQTKRAWKAVQKAYGLAETDSINTAACYQLLECLAVHTAGDWAESVIGERYPALYAADCMQKKLYYDAYLCYLDMGDAARAETCAQPFPSFNELYRNEDYTGGEALLTLCVPAQDADSAVFARIYDGDTLVSTVFISDSEPRSIYLPEGGYRVHTGSGTRWFGEADAFGEAGSYEAFRMNGSDRLNMTAGNEYLLTIRSSEKMEGAPFDLVPIGWEDF